MKNKSTVIVFGIIAAFSSGLILGFSLGKRGRDTIIAHKIDNVYLAFEIEELYASSDNLSAKDSQKIRSIVKAIAYRDMHYLSENNISTENALAAVHNYLLLDKGHQLKNPEVLSDLKRYLKNNE